jgi:hypothetical protein
VLLISEEKRKKVESEKQRWQGKAALIKRGEM